LLIFLDVQLKFGASINDYGARASRDLIVTRGAGFRKEKNKKKRGVSLPEVIPQKARLT
jgi:hypothetical protein